MEWMSDAKACLKVAEVMLQEIQVLQEESFSNDDLIPFLKVKIKNFLENCRSPLDYSAHYTFETYCKTEYTAKERKKFKVYFPIRYDTKEFDILITQQFKGLESKKPEILSVFQEAQTFKTSDWLRDLNRLINKNKHRYLTKHSKQRTAKVTLAQFGGIKITNLTSINNGADISINGTPYNFGDPNPPTGLSYQGATVINEFIFTDIGKSVLPTLTEILNRSQQVIFKLEDLI